MKRLAKEVKKKKLMEAAGGWEDNEEMDRILEKIIADRSKTKARKVDF